MDHFRYIDGRLHAEAVPAARIAASVGTPAFVYSRNTLVDHYTRLRDAFAEVDPLICFSVKCNSNAAVLRTLADLGAGMDLVSGGELFRVEQAGIDPATCVFAGVAKSDDEIRAALHAGVGWINVESTPEMEAVARVAAELGITARVGVRVNPDVDAKTHRHTTTGIRRAKFGIDLAEIPAFFDRFASADHVQLDGLHVHLGSPIYTVEPYVEALTRINALIDQLDASGHTIRTLDLGGGFGADYQSDQTPELRMYADAIAPLLRDRARNGMQLILEPGRMIAANAGVLLLRVIYRKETGGQVFLICDGGMNVLLRPSLYDAFHFIWPARVDEQHVPLSRVEEPDMPGLERVDVVGPICETGDALAKDRLMPRVEAGDLIAVFGAGAYGMAMASNYNSHPLPVEVMVDGDAVTIIRQRQTMADLVRDECDAADRARPAHA